MTQLIPTRHVAGDSFSAQLDGAAHSAANGWAAQLILIGPARHVLPATAAGADHLVAVAATTTAAWAAGSYAMRILFTKGSDRASSDGGTLVVLPDPAAADTGAVSLKGPAQAALEALQALYRAYIASGSFKVQSYEIVGRKMTFRSIEDLVRAIDLARRDAEAERAAERLANGVSPRRTFVVRM